MRIKTDRTQILPFVVWRWETCCLTLRKDRRMSFFRKRYFSLSGSNLIVR